MLVHIFLYRDIIRIKKNIDQTVNLYLQTRLLGHFTGYVDFIGNIGATLQIKILNRNYNFNRNNQIHVAIIVGLSKCYHITISLFCLIRVMLVETIYVT